MQQGRFVLLFCFSLNYACGLGVHLSSRLTRNVVIIRLHLVAVLCIVTSLLAISSPASACNAPDNRHFMHVQNPTCSQLWSYHAYLNVVVSQLYLKTMLLNARLDKTVSTEETKELVFETLSLVNILGDLTSAAPPDQMIKNFSLQRKWRPFLSLKTMRSPRS